MNDERAEWFVQDFRGAYWRANRQGYTFDLADAGLYTLAEAQRIERYRRGDRAVHATLKVKELGERCRALAHALQAGEELLKQARAASVKPEVRS